MKVFTELKDKQGLCISQEEFKDLRYQVAEKAERWDMEKLTTEI